MLSGRKGNTIKLPISSSLPTSIAWAHNDTGGATTLNAAAEDIHPNPWYDSDEATVVVAVRFLDESIRSVGQFHRNTQKGTPSVGQLRNHFH